MIRKCKATHIEAMLSIINDAAEAYRGVIPQECWREPYMTEEDVLAEMSAGVEFWAHVDDQGMTGVISLQELEDTSLIRHVFVRTELTGRGIGTELLGFAQERSTNPTLVDAWHAAEWAISFYQYNGYELLDRTDATSLLNRHWTIPERQIEGSVVLADHAWLRRQRRKPHPKCCIGSLPAFDCIA